MHFLLSGYYGFHNAGDEAVLAAMLEHLEQRAPEETRFSIMAGDPTAVEAMHGAGRRLKAIGRQNPREIVAAIRACDVLLSGGGSLLQDVTSLRNIVYYTSLLRFAQLSRKRTMIYAQGIGPLSLPLSRKLACMAVERATVVAVRDEASRILLQHIGVRRAVEVTADPVWALRCETWNAEDETRIEKCDAKTWCLALRSWPGEREDEAGARSTPIIAAAREAAAVAGVQLRFLPLQPQRDRPWVEAGGARPEEIIATEGWHPCRFVAAVRRYDVMIAVRLHALIFAAAQSVPCVAFNYDPKVAALAKLMDAPLLQDFSAPELEKLPAAIAAARPFSPERLSELQEKAQRNADLAVALLPKRRANHSSLTRQPSP